MKDETRALSQHFAEVSRPILKVDVEKYQSYLDGSGLNQDQKEETLQAMWSIIVTCVELGFGVHPVQEVCGKAPLLGREASQGAHDGVTSEQPESEKKAKGFSPEGQAGG